MPRSVASISIAFVGLAGCFTAGAGTRDTCRVEFVDSYNQFTSIIEVESSEDDDELDFTVFDESTDLTVHAHFDDRDSPLETDAGVPDSSLVEIRERYESDVDTFAASGVVEIDSQLTYTLLPDANCTKDEFALILFLVDEWFYFG
jgi:hypothetical protein